MSSKHSKTLKPWIIKSANVEDAASGDFYEEFAFKKTLGGKGRLRIDRDKARDSHSVLAALARKNAVLPYEDREAVRLIEAAIKSEPRRHRLHVRRLGWMSGRKCFALKREILGVQDGIRTLRPPLWVNDRQVGGTRTPREPFNNGNSILLGVRCTQPG